MKTIDNPRAVTDEVIGEVRRHKRAIAEEFGMDVEAMAKALQRREEGDPRFIALANGKGEQDAGGKRD
jgi:hypothetical protein